MIAMPFSRSIEMAGRPSFGLCPTTLRELHDKLSEQAEMP
jgi:hypothetical protein